MVFERAGGDVWVEVEREQDEERGLQEAGHGDHVVARRCPLHAGADEQVHHTRRWERMRRARGRQRRGYNVIWLT